MKTHTRTHARTHRTTEHAHTYSRQGQWKRSIYNVSFVRISRPVQSVGSLKPILKILADTPRQHDIFLALLPSHRIANSAAARWIFYIIIIVHNSTSESHPHVQLWCHACVERTFSMNKQQTNKRILYHIIFFHSIGCLLLFPLWGLMINKSLLLLLLFPPLFNHM